MITLDSIKIHAPSDVIKNRNTGVFRLDYGCSEDDGQVQKNKLIANGNIHGFKRVEIDNIKNEVQIEMSAKILGDDYFKLINLNTIEQAFDRINNTGIIEIDKKQIDQFSVHSVDCTKNLKGSNPPKIILDNLALLPQNTKYSRAPYRGTGDNKHKTGLVWTGKQKSFKERLLVYDKHTELNTERKFIKSVNNPMAVLNQFHNITRVECAFTNYARIREFFGVSDQNLLRLLGSDQNPNFRVYRRIKGNGNIQLELFTYPETMKWHDLVKYYGLRQMCIDCNGDLSLLADLVRKHVGPKTGISQQMRQIKEVLSALGDIDTGMKTDNEVIIEFENLLKAG